MLESAFEIDDNIAIYNGYTDGTHWNGWACPWFTKETALEIADAHNAKEMNDEAIKKIALLEKKNQEYEAKMNLFKQCFNAFKED